MYCQNYLKNKYTNTTLQQVWAELNKSSPVLRHYHKIKLSRSFYVRSLQATFSEEDLSAMDYKSAHPFFKFQQDASQVRILHRLTCNLQHNNCYKISKIGLLRISQCSKGMSFTNFTIRRWAKEKCTRLVEE